jgi:hypothetical protein
MGTSTYDEFRGVLRKLSFTKTRSGRHETWQKKLPDGSVLRVTLKHQRGKDIPRWLFGLMLKQAGIDRATFERLRKD